MKKIGVILSDSTTIEATCQLLEGAEKGKIREGKLAIIQRNNGNGSILARIGSIKPYNAFFTVGDPWSEARRKEMKIPDEVARQYEVCGLDLLKEMPNGSDVRYPPSPGDLVIEIDPEKNIEEIFNVKKNKEGISWFGSMAGYKNIKVPLNIENLPMHMAIFGVTGSGKSFTAGSFFEKILNIPYIKGKRISYPMVIIDAHGDYTNYAEYFQENPDDLELRSGWIKHFIFPKRYNSQHKISQKTHIERLGIDLNKLSFREVSEMVIQFYKGPGELSELQINGLENIIDELVSVNGYTIQSLFIHHINVLKKSIDKNRDIHSSSKRAINSAITKFYDEIENKQKLLSSGSLIKDDDFVENLTSKRGVAIIDFSAEGAPGVINQTKQLVMGYLATLLFNKFTEFKINSENRYLLFVIEEAQNFCPSSSYPVGSSLSQSKLSAIATQGRKFGLSLCLISQRPSFVDSVILSMCNTFFIHRISPGDVSFVMNVTGGLPSSLGNKLTNLGKGQFIANGQMLTVGFPLLMYLKKKDRKIKHKAGSTNVVEGIAKSSGLIE